MEKEIGNVTWKNSLARSLNATSASVLSDTTVMVVWFQGKGKAVIDQHTYHLEQQRAMPIRMAQAKNIAQNWAIFFYALETLDIIAASGINYPTCYIYISSCFSCRVF